MMWDGDLGYVGKHRRVSYYPTHSYTPHTRPLDRLPYPTDYEGKHREPRDLWELIKKAYREGRSYQVEL